MGVPVWVLARYSAVCWASVAKARTSRRWSSMNNRNATATWSLRDRPKWMRLAQLAQVLGEVGLNRGVAVFKAIVEDKRAALESGVQIVQQLGDALHVGLFHQINPPQPTHVPSVARMS